MRKKYFSTDDMLNYSFVEIRRVCDDINNKASMINGLENIAQKATMVAAYLEARHNCGTGEKSHAVGLKALNRAGKLLHCKVFGYNMFRDYSF